MKLKMRTGNGPGMEIQGQGTKNIIMDTTYIGSTVIEGPARHIGDVDRHKGTIWFEESSGRADGTGEDQKYGGSKSGRPRG
jgi:hypothetical protein